VLTRCSDAPRLVGEMPSTSAYVGQRNGALVIPGISAAIQVRALNPDLAGKTHDSDYAR
jgi:hypothetical protein